MNVNVHTHIIPSETLGKAGRWGPGFERRDGSVLFRVGDYVIRPLRAPDEAGSDWSNLIQNDPTARLTIMDEQGIDMQGITVSPLCYMYWADPETAIGFARIQNDACAQFCATHPDRYFFIPTLPLQDMAASLVELDRAWSDLGGRGVYLGTNDIAGRELDDEYFYPLYEKVEAADAPMFLHPYPYPLGAICREPEGGDRYNLSWISGYLGSETDAFIRLVLGGVLDVFPGLKVILPHGGGMVPFQIGRIEHAWARMADVRAQRSVRDYLGNFYFDMTVHTPEGQRMVLNLLGADHLLAPATESWEAVDAVQMIERLEISADDKQRILGETAARLFKLPSTPGARSVKNDGVS